MSDNIYEFTQPRSTVQIPRAPIWTYKADSCGYTIYRNDIAQYGARTLGTRTHTSDGKRRRWQHVRADLEMYIASAKNQCDLLNAKEEDKLRPQINH